MEELGVGTEPAILDEGALQLAKAIDVKRLHADRLRGNDVCERVIEEGDLGGECAAFVQRTCEALMTRLDLSQEMGRKRDVEVLPEATETLPVQFVRVAEAGHTVP